jgi:IS30 family transposase
MPKSSDLSICPQEKIDAIALSLNIRPKEIRGWKTPLAVHTKHMARLQLQPDLAH